MIVLAVILVLLFIFLILYTMLRVGAMSAGEEERYRAPKNTVNKKGNKK